MKNIIYFHKTLLFLSFVLATLLGAYACTMQEKAEDTKVEAEDKNGAKFNNANVEADAQFLVNVAEIYLEEIRLGQLAQQYSKMPDVKALGKMVEDAHTKTLKELNVLAKNKSVTIPITPTKDVEAAYNQLYKKTGRDFDKEFCDIMVIGHKESIATFERASKESNDPEIKGWANALLPNLRTHLTHAITCQDKIKKM